MRRPRTVARSGSGPIALVAVLCLTATGCGEQIAETATEPFSSASPATAAPVLPTLEPGAWDDTDELPPDQAALVGPDPSWGWLTAEECAVPHDDGSQRCTMAVVRSADGSCGVAYLPLEPGAPIPRDMSIDRGCEKVVIID